MTARQLKKDSYTHPHRPYCVRLKTPRCLPSLTCNYNYSTAYSCHTHTHLIFDEAHVVSGDKYAEQ